jgi:hypothetical protein
MQVLTLSQAVACYQQLALKCQPATLHPAYVQADAARNPALMPTFLLFQQGRENWLHALHLAAVPGTAYHDASSPYGYGGPLSTTDDPAFLAAAGPAYRAWMLAQQVVVEYIRFHPLLVNQRHYSGTVLPNRTVVSVDLEVPDLLTSCAPRVRTTVNKATRQGLKYIEHPLVQGGALLSVWGAYYRAAMHAMDADPFYAFDDVYFSGLAASGLARLGVCLASDAPDAPWLAACLLLDGQGVTEYHLAATCEMGRRLGASSYVLHQAGVQARERGQLQLYLGGGSTGAPDNPLLFFKAGFSANRLEYSTGFQVFDPVGYVHLQQQFVQEWAEHPDRPIFYRKV